MEVNPAIYRNILLKLSRLGCWLMSRLHLGTEILKNLVNIVDVNPAISDRISSLPLEEL